MADEPDLDGRRLEGLPDFAELTERPGSPRGSTWGMWGDTDRLGCLNLLTQERIAAGLACVRDHTVWSLNWDLHMPSPPLFGRTPLKHNLLTWSSGGHDDMLDQFNTQSSSQWDGFRHMRHPQHGFYGGIADEDHGIQWWARRGIVGRAVLADVDRWRTACGKPIRRGEYDSFSVTDVLATLEAQGTAVEAGDILLIRTGWITWYTTLNDSQRGALSQKGTTIYSCGLAPGEETIAGIWNMHLSAIAADNLAVESMPGGGGRDDSELARLQADPGKLNDIMIHAALIALLGLPLGELWHLDALADACAIDQRYECLLVSAPLNLEGGAASPANALAIR